MLCSFRSRLRDRASAGSLASLLVGAGLAAGLVVALPAPARAAFEASAEGSAVAVTSDHAEATRAGLETLRAGGSAVDGAISVALTLGVVNPIASGIGGGGFALVYSRKDDKVTVLDFREAAPARVNADRVVAKDGERGHHVGVPGEPAGLAWLHARFGKRSLAADALPAAQLAARGYPLGRHMADMLPRMQEYVAPSTALTRLFYPEGVALPFRTLVRRPDLARTLVRFGAEGARPFYEGDLAAQIVTAAREQGGTLEAADMTGYKVVERAPLTRTFGDRTVYTMPAPSGGGLMLLQLLGMYGADGRSPLVNMGFGSSQYLHTVAEGIRGALSDRMRMAGDPAVEPGVDAAFQRALDPAHLSARRARIDPNKTLIGPEFKLNEQGTSHFVVADAEGNVVSLTTTVNGPFGARIVAGNTGILLNDEMTDFTAPADVAAFKLPDGSPNRPRPGARPMSSMTPTIVFERGQPILAVGGSGGMRIAPNVTQVTLARLLFGLDPAACVGSPRVAVNGTSTDLFVEPEVPEDVRVNLRARGEGVKDEKFLTTAVQMVAWDRSGPRPRLLAASDPRKASFAIAQ